MSAYPTNSKSNSAVNSKTDRTRERIISAATSLFASKGYDGTSTKEICDAAEANIAAIHYYFDSKEGLLRHILEAFGTSSVQAVERILEPPQSCEECCLRLRMFIEDTLDSYFQQPDTWRIVCLEAELLKERSEDVFRRTFVRRHEKLVKFLTQAKELGIIAPHIDPAFAARFLFSQIAHHTRFNAVMERFHGVSLHDKDYRAAWVKQTLDIFFSGVGKRTS